MTTSAESLRAHPQAAERLLAALHDRIGAQKFNAWFKHGTRLSVEDGLVKLAVPNPFVANWIETHYQGELAAAADEHAGGGQRILITVDPQLSGDVRKHQLDTQADIVTRTAEGRVRARAAVEPPRLKHTLEDFVVGEGNKLAHAAALAMTGPGKAPFNPLFIHGHCGLGKTHLLQGICNVVARTRGPGGPPAWRYVTGEQFTNEFITGLRQRKLDEFRARYRRLHLLAIDDVHFLSAKKATQDEFLHTFNALEIAGARIVMASDAHPRLVGELNTQLLSRFVAGMVVKIEPPDQATRVEILRRRSGTMRLHVPDDVLKYVALHIRGSVRELEGALVKLAALAALQELMSLELPRMGHEVTVCPDGLTAVAAIKRNSYDCILVDLDMPGMSGIEVIAKARELSPQTDAVVLTGKSSIETAVAAFFGITPADLHSSRRTKTVSTARMVAMTLARRHTRMSFPEIGRFMGKNHSSVVLAVKRLEKILAEGKELAWSSAMGSKSMPADRLLDALTEQIL